MEITKNSSTFYIWIPELLEIEWKKVNAVEMNVELNSP